MALEILCSCHVLVGQNVIKAKSLMLLFHALCPVSTVLVWEGQAASLSLMPCLRGWNMRRQLTSMGMWHACAHRGTIWCRLRISISSSMRPCLRQPPVETLRCLHVTSLPTSRSWVRYLRVRVSQQWNWSSRWAEEHSLCSPQMSALCITGLHGWN